MHYLHTAQLSQPEFQLQECRETLKEESKQRLGNLQRETDASGNRKRRSWIPARTEHALLVVKLPLGPLPSRLTFQRIKLVNGALSNSSPILTSPSCFPFKPVTSIKPPFRRSGRRSNLRGHRTHHYYANSLNWDSVPRPSTRGPQPVHGFCCLPAPCQTVL